jgi:hypothetical protein
VHAANQVVDTTKSLTTYIDTTANGVDLINIANPNYIILGWFFKNTLYFNSKKPHRGR